VKFFFLIGIISAVIFVAVALSASYIIFISHSTIGVTPEDERFMNLSYELAQSSYDHGDIPVGAVLVVNGTIISSSETTAVRTGDFRNHAEMIVINDALNKLHIHDFRELRGSTVTLYTSYEPCAMCEGFIVYTSLPRVVVGARKSYLHEIIEEYFNHIVYRFNERGGISEQTQKSLLTKYMSDMKSKYGRINSQDI